MTSWAPLSTLGLLAGSLGLAACAPPSGGPTGFDAMSAEEHLSCAVAISAYTYLVADRKVPDDPALVGQAVLALSWHRNAYAIPQDKGGKGDAINAARKQLMAKERPAAIAERASACIAAAIAKHEAS